MEDSEQLGRRRLGQRNPLTEGGNEGGREVLGGQRETATAAAAAAGTLDESQWKSDPVLPHRIPGEFLQTMRTHDDSSQKKFLPGLQPSV